MLETIRQYGLRRLVARGEEALLRRRHYEHFREMAARDAVENTGNPQEVAWQHRLETDLPNLRAAMDHGATLPDDPRGAVVMAVDLSHLSFFTLLARHADVPAAAVLFARGVFAMFVDSDPAAVELLARARDGFRADGAAAHAHVATIFWVMATVALGGPDAAVAVSADWLEQARAQGGLRTCAWALWSCGLAELRHGDPRRAVAHLREALHLQQEIGDRWGPLWSTELLAWAVAAQGDHDEAAALLDQAQAMRTDTGIELAGLFRDTHNTIEAAVRSSLGGLAKRSTQSSP